VAGRGSDMIGDTMGENMGAVGVEEPLLTAATSSKLGDRVGVARTYEPESCMRGEAPVRSSSISDADCVRGMNSGGTSVDPSDPVKKQNLNQKMNGQWMFNTNSHDVLNLLV
jgi:hypothetical protein